MDLRLRQESAVTSLLFRLQLGDSFLQLGSQLFVFSLECFSLSRAPNHRFLNIRSTLLLPLYMAPMVAHRIWQDHPDADHQLALGIELETTVECCIASKQTISDEKGWEHKVFLFFC